MAHFLINLIQSANRLGFDRILKPRNRVLNRQADAIFDLNDPSVLKNFLVEHSKRGCLNSFRRIVASLDGDKSIKFSPNDLRRVLLVLSAGHELKNYPANYGHFVNSVLDSFSDNLSVLRRAFQFFMMTRKYDRALYVAKKISHHPKNLASMQAKRIELLARLGQSATIERYVAVLTKQASAQGTDLSKIAERMFYARRPSLALKTVSLVPDWKSNVTLLLTAVRSLIALRRYVEAAVLVETSEIASSTLESSLKSKLQVAVNYIRTQGIKTTDGTDNALAVYQNWIQLAKNAHSEKVSCDPSKVVISTYSMGLGGAERQVVAIARSLAQMRSVASVCILAHSRAEKEHSILDIDNKVHFGNVDEIALANLPTTQMLKDFREVGGLFGLGRVWKSIVALQFIKPEVLHVRGGLHGQMAIAGLFVGTPKIVLQFGSMTRGQQSFGSDYDFMAEQLLEAICKDVASERVVLLAANSEAAANDWSRSIGRQPGFVETHYNAIDAVELGFDKQKTLVVGGVFRFQPVKGPFLWIDVAQKIAAAHNNVKFLLVGDGPMRRQMENRIKRLGLTEKFKFVGAETKNIAQRYFEMDVFLLTSQTESLPNVVLEAQLAGVPVVAPHVGGVAEAIASSKSAKIVERNVDALAEAVLYYLTRTEIRTRIKVEAPALIAKRFSNKNQVATLTNAYGWTASKRKKSKISEK